MRVLADMVLSGPVRYYVLMRGFMAERSSGLFSSLEYHVRDDAGHSLMMEQPERFNRTMSGFLKKHFLRAGG
jgi:pimeloyl-ACP methyl ester carboxylesterase